MPERRAEVGGTNAGFVNIATKEGSNKYHGEAFYIGRPSALTSSDTFGHSLDNAQNEFGGSLGGPIKRNRAFFYVGAEQDYLNVPYWTQFEAAGSGRGDSAIACGSAAADCRQQRSHFGLRARRFPAESGEYAESAVQLQSR